MNDTLEPALREVAEETLQSLAFLFPLEPETEVEVDQTGETATARVSYTGPRSGCLLVTVPRSMLPSLTANMLGLPEAQVLAAGQEVDALKELANVICGNLLPAVAGREAVFRISAPEVLEAGERDLDPAHGEPAGAAFVPLEEGWARLELYMGPASSEPGGPG
jgi:hypothetical protein